MTGGMVGPLQLCQVKVRACLDVTCHLQSWQNDCGLLYATVVTGEGTHIELESAQKINSGEERSPAGTQTCSLSIMSQVLYKQATVYCVMKNRNFIHCSISSSEEQPAS